MKVEDRACDREGMPEVISWSEAEEKPFYSLPRSDDGHEKTTPAVALIGVGFRHFLRFGKATG